MDTNSCFPYAQQHLLRPGKFAWLNVISVLCHLSKKEDGGGEKKRDQMLRRQTEEEDVPRRKQKFTLAPCHPDVTLQETTRRKECQPCVTGGEIGATRGKDFGCTHVFVVN